VTSAEIDAMWSPGSSGESEAHFRALIDRLEGEPQAEAMVHLARALARRRRFEDAEAWLDEAVDGGPKARMRATLERGRLRWAAGNAEAAIRLCHEALRQAEALGLDEYAVDAARMLGAAYDGEEGIEWTQTAIAIATESPDPRTQNWLGELHLALGRGLVDLSRHAEAHAAFAHALAFGEETAHGDLVTRARRGLAQGLRLRGRYVEALAHLEALAAAAEGDAQVQEEIDACRLALDHSQARVV
jgi:tetratricopeptide (TPR) repeat protein